MADVRAFRGIRYNESRHADLSPVLSPPHDSLSSGSYNILSRRSSHNAVRLIAGGPRRSSARSGMAAAKALEAWLADETLLQDPAPAFYVLDQEFTVGEERVVRRAFIARLRIEAFGKGCVYAHEESTTRVERREVDLLAATRVNMVPVLGLYSDDGCVRSVLDEAAGLEPVAMGVDPDGVKNILRAVYHPGLINALTAAMCDKQIVIADGHLTYRAALKYRDRQRPLVNGVPTFEEPHEFIAAALATTADAASSIRPVHRFVSGFRRFKPERFLGRAAADYHVEEVRCDPPGILARLDELSDRHAFGIVTRAGACVLLRKAGARAEPGTMARLDTHVLTEEVFEGLLDLDVPRARREGRIAYTDDAHECVGAVKRGKGDLGVLLNPARIEELEATAFAGRAMPLKSVVFLPRVPGGLVIAPLI